jgi:Cft2 family RNA processing exonuclease
LEIVVLGGAEEIGANSTFISFGDCSVIIDAGSHPRNRDKTFAPDFTVIDDEIVSAFILTHAHTDHIGALPILAHQFPTAKIYSTEPTRDVTEIMLRNSSKLLHYGNTPLLVESFLERYKKQELDILFQLMHIRKVGETIPIHSALGTSEVQAKFYDAGHIMGAAGVLLQSNEQSVFHTGDFLSENQYVMGAASFPNHHVDVLITECTNGSDATPTSRKQQEVDLANFINSVTNENGSVLIPTFSLGKMQEMLRLISILMQRNSIPTIPIVTGGMGRKICQLYDRYCYTGTRVNPGFEMADIPQERLPNKELLKGRFFKTPSIVLTTSGMLHSGTPSFKLALEWMKRPNFGIAIVGYQDPTCEGFALEQSVMGEEFMFGTMKATRNCKLEKFRFSAHATKEQIVNLVHQQHPKNVLLVHGEYESCSEVALTLVKTGYEGNIIIPTQGQRYNL